MGNHPELDKPTTAYDIGIRLLNAIIEYYNRQVRLAATHQKQLNKFQINALDVFFKRLNVNLLPCGCSYFEIESVNFLFADLQAYLSMNVTLTHSELVQTIKQSLPKNCRPFEAQNICSALIFIMQKLQVMKIVEPKTLGLSYQFYEGEASKNFIAHNREFVMAKLTNLSQIAQNSDCDLLLDVDYIGKIIGITGLFNITPSEHFLSPRHTFHNRQSNESLFQSKIISKSDLFEHIMGYFMYLMFILKMKYAPTELKEVSFLPKFMQNIDTDIVRFGLGCSGNHGPCIIVCIDFEKFNKQAQSMDYLKLFGYTREGGYYTQTSKVRLVITIPKSDTGDATLVTAYTISQSQWDAMLHLDLAM